MITVEISGDEVYPKEYSFKECLSQDGKVFESTEHSNIILFVSNGKMFYVYKNFLYSCDESWRNYRFTLSNKTVNFTVKN